MFVKNLKHVWNWKSVSFSVFACRLQGGRSACLGEERGRVGEGEESQRETHAGGEDDGQQISRHMLQLKPPSTVLFTYILHMNNFMKFCIFKRGHIMKNSIFLNLLRYKWYRYSNFEKYCPQTHSAESDRCIL